MTLQQVLFILFGTITLGAALMVVTRRNAFRAALFLILSLFGVAGLYVLLEAPLLAAGQLLVSIGGTATLIVGGVMHTRQMGDPHVRATTRQWVAAALVAVALCGVLCWAVLNHAWEPFPAPVREDNIATLGRTLMDPRGLMVPFAVTSVALLVALIGAVTVARER